MILRSLKRGLLALFLALNLGFALLPAYAQDTPTNAPTTGATDNGGAGGGTATTDISKGGPGLMIPTDGVPISSAISQKSFAATVISIVNYFIGFLGFVATILVIYAGVLMVVSAGNEEAVTKGKKILTYTAIGFVVIILSFSFVNFLAGSSPGGGPDGTGTTPTETGGRCPTTDPNAPICASNETCVKNNETDTWGCQVVSTGQCVSDQDCKDPGLKCSSGRCVALDSNQTTSGESQSPAKPDLDQADDDLDGLGAKLDISSLGTSDQDKIKEAMNAGTLDGKIDALRKLRDDPSLSLSFVGKIDQLIDGLDRLKSLRETMDKLRDDMPETEDIIAKYDDTSDALNKVIGAPTDTVLFRRFENRYKELSDMIRKYPVVVARIRATPGSGNAPLTVQFDGLDSLDPTGGTISDYRWSMTEATGGETSLGNSSVVMHDFTEANTYAVSLRVSTSKRDSKNFPTAGDGITTLRVKVNPPTSDVRFRINGIEASDMFHVTMAEAQAGVSFDPSPTTPSLGRRIEKYDWSFGDGNPETRVSPITVVHTYTKPGEYFVRLQVTDNIGTKDSRIVKLLVKSVAADIQIAPETGNVNTQFIFNGERSRSDEGYITDYDWKITDKDGKTMTEKRDVNFSHRFTRPGTYIAELVVTDLTGAKDKAIQDFKVESRAPKSGFTTSIPKGNRPAEVAFDGSDSYDPDEGDKLTYSWDFEGDGTFNVTNANEPVVLYTYKHTGEYKAVLQVTDSFGLTHSSTRNVSIDSILSASIGLERRTAKVGEEVTFTADQSNAVAYLWDFGDGLTQSTEKTSVTHKYDKAGKFNVTLNFFDAEDEENTDTRRILVGSGDKPIASISATVNGREPAQRDDICGKGKPGIVVTRADLVRFDARGSMNTDGSSRLLTYDWEFPNGDLPKTRDYDFKFTDVNRKGECFSVSLTVRDTLSGKISDEDVMNFMVINQLPQVTDFVITAPEGDLVTPLKVGLRVVNARDPDGTIKKFKWYYTRQGFENERLGLHNTATPGTEMVITSQGEPEARNKYTFVVVVVDSDNGEYSSLERFGEVSELEVQNGPNLSPIADFSMDKSTVTVGDSITFQSTSYDPQGETLSPDAFRWDFDGDGQFDDISTGPQVSRRYNTPGEYTVRLRVENRGLSSSATHTVVVEAANAMPQAAFTYQIDGNKVQFDASTSRYDPSLEDITLHFEWDFDISKDANGDGINDNDVESTEMKPANTYPDKVLYKARLKVKDSLGMEGVVVRDINLAQTAEERQRSALKTLRITSSKQPVTSLELEIVPSDMQKGDSADVSALILNADNTPYTGTVYFEILEGGGVFSPNPVDAKDSRAASIFSATDTGKVRIRVRAAGTVYGDMTEEATINVR